MPTTFYRQATPATVEFLGVKPKVLVAPSALERMWHYCDLCSTEVGWLGTVRRVGADFLIDEVFLFEQEVSGVTTEISPDGLAAVGMELMDRPDGMEVVNSLHFWGHSHVQMGVTPSGQDEAQMRLFRENDCEYYIRGIFNKKGEVRFDIFLFADGLVIREAQWEVYQPSSADLAEEIARELAEKVSLLPPPVPVGGFGDWRNPNPILGKGRKKGGKKW